MAKNPVYNWNSFHLFLMNIAKQNALHEIKVGKIQLMDFNDMEGRNYLISIQVVTPNGYKNKRCSLYTNSTFLEELGEWNKLSGKDSLQEKLQNYLDEGWEHYYVGEDAAVTPLVASS